MEIDPRVDIYQGDQNRKPTGQLRKVMKHLKQCRNNNRTLRDEYQQRKASEEATTDDIKNISKIVKRMQHHEAMIGMYVIMKWYLKPASDGGTSFIMIPDKEIFKTMCQTAITTYEQENNITNRDTIMFLYHYMTDDKNGLTKMLPHHRVVNFDEMNKALLDHHHHHFGQAQSTPFPVSPSKEQRGYTTEGPLARQLKDGTAKVEDLALEEHTTDILKELTWQEHYPPKNSAE
eukprot:10615111-Ditylum_brightwellii.AAC.1